MQMAASYARPTMAINRRNWSLNGASCPSMHKVGDLRVDQVADQQVDVRLLSHELSDVVDGAEASAHVCPDTNPAIPAQLLSGMFGDVQIQCVGPARGQLRQQW